MEGTLFLTKEKLRECNFGERQQWKRKKKENIIIG